MIVKSCIMVKGIIFDLDGTLVDLSLEYRKKVMDDTLTFFGKTTTTELIDKFWYGIHRPKIVENDFGINPNDFWKVFREIDNPNERVKQTVVYNDTRNVLEKLRDNKIKQGIVTGSIEETAKKVSYIIGKFFENVISTHSPGMEHKPHPISLEVCLEKMGLDKKDALYIGNSREDVETGQNAGVRTYIIKRPNQNPDVDSRILIPNLYEVLNLISK